VKKTYLIIFAKRNKVGQSLELIEDAETFVSQYSTNPLDFDCHTVTIEDALAEKISEKIGNPEFRVRLVASNFTGTTPLHGVPTLNVWVNASGELLLKSEVLPA
jgi:hypothetical protein